MSSLPNAQKSRWQPLRGGLLNLYFFEDEVFEYEDGRLLLRGNNGSGKSRVLALQLPFLLDGETRPERMEPDGDTAKRVEWHLLMNGRYADRTGYTWLELGRSVDGMPEYRTIGCGMHAVQGKGTPTKWFFVTNQRIGQDLNLVGAGNVPLTRARLVDAIGKRGEVLESAERYRAAVDQQLFGLGPQRYRALVDLLIALRKPQLSRNLEEERLSMALSEALPPVSAEILGDVADALRGLETDRAELEASRSAAAGIVQFMEGYRRYVSVAARRRAREVRAAQSAFETAAKEARTAATSLEAAQHQASVAKDLLSTSKLSGVAAEQAVRTLESSPEMRNVQALADAEEAAEQAAKAAARAQTDRERAVADVNEATTRAAASQSEVNQRTADTEAALTTVKAKAASALLQRVASEATEITIAPFDSEAFSKYRKLVERELSQRREHLKVLKALDKKATRLRDDLSRCGVAVENARIARDYARDTWLESTRRRDAAGVEALAAYEAWRSNLVELAPPPGELIEEELGVWISTAPAIDTPLRRAIDAAMRFAVEQLAGLRTQLVGLLDLRKGELADLEQLREQLLSGEQRKPPPRYTLRGSRDEREGAPLWAVCDFHDSVDAAARAGLEAALEASGLLDAWITNDGAVVSQPDGDVYLNAVTDSPLVSLTSILRVAIDRDDPRARVVADATVQKILEGIGATRESGGTWVDESGQFSVGVLSGAWTKSSAEFIGHGAREEARKSRLRELEAQLTAARAEVELSIGQLAAHDRRRVGADEEHSRAPSDEPLRAAVEQVVRDELALKRAETLVQTTQDALDDAREIHDQARQELLDAASAVGLAGELECFDLVAELTQETEIEATRFWAFAGSLLSALSHLTSARDMLHRATERLTLAEGALTTANTERTARVARAATLRDSIGASDILERLGSARAARTAAKAAEDAAQQQVIETTGSVSRLEERVDASGRLLDERTNTRDLAAESLVELAQTRVLEAIVGFETVEDRRLSTTAVIEMARRLESLLSSVPAEANDWERIQRELNGRFTDLDAALAPHGHRPAMVDQAGVRMVRIPFRGQEISANELAGVLADDVSSRERILAAREREIIESHLLGEISTHLHDRLRRAEELLVEMNDEIENRPMSTGMRLRFTWAPHSDAPPGFDTVRSRLLATEATWSADERRAIADFLQERIRDVRSREDAGTWQEHLALAFDYRKWHRFGISRFQDSRWQALTRRTHGTGSGGEKAIALTLPQLAAAAAHYRSAAAHAPRLILLDEAFVGVDNDMRGKCFDLLSAFDLDFVMTSEREWGCYPTVPALAIYQLTTRPGIDAVHTARLVWNGRQLKREDHDLGS